MKSIAVASVLVTVSSAFAADILIEAESFDDRGGWLVDPQFADVMGSPYLLAHGLGKPVASAKTQVEFPQPGEYRLWARTKDWANPHQPGRFRVVVDGKELDVTFGIKGDDWLWQDGGTIQIRDTAVTVELKDLTGFDGRCDALFLTTDSQTMPPAEPDEVMRRWRRVLSGLPQVPPSAGTFDVVIVGGGVAGCSAAVTAARLGLSVALVQDRPELGGNSSSEIGIHPAGINRSVVLEVAGPKRAETVAGEKRIRPFLNWRAFRVQTESNRIASVDAKHTSTGKELRFVAPVFVDCTGDGWIGYWAGAEYRMGREGQAEFNESLAPQNEDKMTHGSTLFFKIEALDQPTAFPDVPWATDVSQDHLDLRSNHSWEYGHRLDMIQDAEAIRDHLLRAIFGTFGTAKRKFAKAARNAALTRVNHIAARGESRRLMGDYLLTENDIREQRPFSDGVARGGLVFCLHYPGKKHDFRNEMKLIRVDPYLIPFRCLYSRNVENLMMAGRDISATHVAYSSTKLMKTGGQMGVAVGAAARLCKKYTTTPRHVYKDHVEELKDIVFERGKYEDALKPQRTANAGS